ncbi:MAG: rod shape-determining protein MreC [Anaerolineaceae bacterium]|nr:rod shape-determining protein MreC [Anaerolineaceae bacterium]
MRKRINFKNWKKIVLVLLVLGIAFFALSGYMAKAIDRVLAPVVRAQSTLMERLNFIINLFSISQDQVALAAENEELKNQIAELQNRIIQLQQNLNEADILYALLGFARSSPDEQYVPAKVIGKDPSPFLKYILIDQGSDAGIRSGMPVVTNKGLVGRVDAVTASASRVRLITDSTSMINAVVVEADAECVVQGSITGDITIEMVSQDVNLEPGQVIQTSGLGGDYPADFIVGQVLNVNQINNEIFQSASILPAEDFNSLQAVLVVSNFSPANIGPLE